MRDYLRRKADRVWVIDCSPEGHQPNVPTRIFQGVQQPICIVLAVRSKQKNSEQPASVKYTVVPTGDRKDKFEFLSKLKIGSKVWQDCSTDWRAPFLPAASSEWASFPALDELFAYNGSGVMPGRTWVIAPDSNSLCQRWDSLIAAKSDQKEVLFHPHLRNGKPGDKHLNKSAKALPGFPENNKTVASEIGKCRSPILYGYRSFDRQWILPDSRLINQPNPELWRSHGGKQVYLTGLHRTAPSSGPAITFSAMVPDLDHYKGSFGGRVFPLWRDAEATTPNLPPKLLEHFKEKFNQQVWN